MKTFLKGPGGRILRGAISVVTVGLLAWWVDWRQVGRALSGAEPLWAIAGFGLLLLNSLLQALRWRGMLRRPDIPPVKFLHFVFVGHFANLFLPSQLGADALRAVGFGRHHGDVQANIGVQIAMRVSGLLALVVFSLAGFVLYWPRLVPALRTSSLDLGPWAGWLGAVALSGIGLGIALLWRFRQSAWMHPLLQLAVDRRYLLDSLLWSFAIQLATSLAVVAQFRALVPDPDVGMILLFTSIAQVLLWLPLSIGGLGVREWVLLVLFSQVGGIAQETVLAVTLLGYANLVGLALLGGGWILYRGAKDR